MSIVSPLLDGRRQRRPLLLLLGAVLFVILLLRAYQLWSGYQQDIEEAETKTRNYAAIFEARLDATLRRTDAVLEMLVQTLPVAALNQQAVPLHAKQINTSLDLHLLNFEELGALRVVDAHGDLLYTSANDAIKRVNLADRSYFRRLRDNPQAGLIFAEVLTSRFTGRQSMVLARALLDRQGRFLGIVFAATELAYFEKLFQSLDVGERGLMAIRRSDDFSLVVRWPLRDGEINKSLPENNPTRLAISAGQSEATMEFAATTDGVVRIFSIRRLQRYPFYVLAGLARDDVLAGWRTRALSIGLSGLLLFAFLAALLLRLWRTEAREAEAFGELEKSEARARAVTESARDAIVTVDLSGNVVGWNPAATRLFGFSEAEIRGRPLTLIIPPRFHDGAMKGLYALMHGDPRQIDGSTGELTARHKDGSEFFVERSIALWESAEGRFFTSVVRDIRERKAAEGRLRLLAGVFEHSGEAIVITDRNNLIIEVNQAFSRLTGYSADEVYGRNPSLLASGRSTREEHQAMWQEIIAQGHWHGEIWDRRKDGSCYPKWLNISTIKGAAGSIDYYIGSFMDISEQKAAADQIKHLAHHDALTGLPNRHHLQGRLDQALAVARREGTRVALMFLDMDHFKNINDTLGHHVGDGLLQEFASRLASSVRDSDVVARLGGDEFVVVLTGVEAVSAGRLAAKVLDALAQPYFIDGHELHSTSSVGIALSPDDGDSVELLMRSADTAMYHAKSVGRDNVQFFAGSMNFAVRDRQALEAGLHQALPRQELFLHYQPQVDGTGRVIGAEALLRWQHPEQGLISPLRFIPVAEESGLILPIGRWVLSEACALLKAWSGDAQTCDLKLAVNVSPRQFRQPDFVEQVKSVLLGSGANPLCLKLELTESLVLEDVEDTIEKMYGIQQLGIGFSMDDFGTGYSSLAYLTRLPLDQLKIDRSFISNLPDRKNDAVVAQTIINMGLSLGLDVIAEGVENEAQRDFLAQHDCHAYQGFLFSKPLPLAEFEQFLQRSLRSAVEPS